MKGTVSQPVVPPPPTWGSPLPSGSSVSDRYAMKEKRHVFGVDRMCRFKIVPDT